MGKNRRIASLLLAGIMLSTNISSVYAETSPEELVSLDNKCGYLITESDYNAPEYIEDTFKLASVESSYNTDIASLRQNYPARNQNPYGTCWAFSTIGLAEMDMRINHGYSQALDLSELQLAYYGWHSPENDPLGGTKNDTVEYYDTELSYLDRGGNYEMAVRRLMQWCGLISEEKLPYSLASSINTLGDEYAYSYNEVHLENAYNINLYTNPSQVKQAIKTYGAVGAVYLHRDIAINYNSNKDVYTYYDNVERGGGHAVEFVGWDDNFDINNFPEGLRPSSNGAWLVRNSWGNYCDYFWMSYENKSLLPSVWALDFSANDNFDNNYQYDGAMLIYTDPHTQLANVFTVKSDDGLDEKLKAISFSATQETDIGYKIEIYKDVTGNNPTSGTLIEDATTTGRTTLAGVYTVNLKKEVLLKEGTKFSIVITTDKSGIDHEQNSPINYGSYIYNVGSKEGQSYFYENGSFYDYNHIGNNCIKAFTNNCTIDEPVEYTVNFDANGGNVTTTTKNVVYGSTYGELPTPTRTGYTFEGWYTAKSGGTKIETGTNVAITSTQTLYARWKVIPYTITYNLNGGTNSTSNPTEYNVESGNIVLATPTKTGYTFEGWYSDSSYTTKVTQIPGGSTGNKNLYAKWSVNAYVVNFDSNGGSVTTTTKNVVYGSTYGELPAPTRKGYTFEGWYTAKSGGTKIEAGTNVAITSTQTLYARWKVIPYTITYNLNGGTNSTSNPTEYNVESGNIVLATPAKTGYKFEGWYSESSYATKVIQIPSGSTGNKTLYAKWEKVIPVVSVAYRTHVQNVGWQNYVRDGQMSGTTGKALRLEGINIKVSGNENLGITYTTHVQDIGWMKQSNNDEMSGTSGKALRLEAIMIGLTGKDADKYDVFYRVHAQNIGWMNWVKNGTPAGTAGYAYRLEGIQIAVVQKGTSVDTVQAQYGNGIKSVCSTGYNSKSGSALPALNTDVSVEYRTHVENVGWQNYVADGSMSGTSGKSLRLEGINISLKNSIYSGDIEYRTHIQNIGWEKDWKKNGTMSGTSGKALRLEGIQIRLTGELAEHYDVYYRVHAQNFGWLGWAKNGEESGTAGYAYRLEGIQIVLVEKGQSAPGNTFKGVTSNNTRKFLKK